jgi:hypothetical protein
MLLARLDVLVVRAVGLVVVETDPIEGGRPESDSAIKGHGASHGFERGVAGAFGGSLQQRRPCW